MPNGRTDVGPWSAAEPGRASERTQTDHRPAAAAAAAAVADRCIFDSANIAFETL